MKITHKTPNWQPRPEPITEGYQAEIDASMRRAEKAWREAEQAAARAAARSARHAADLDLRAAAAAARIAADDRWRELKDYEGQMRGQRGLETFRPRIRPPHRERGNAMRGKEAAASARRRESHALVLATRRERELQTERAAAKRRIHDLEDEIARLHADHVREARKVADSMVREALEKAAADRRSRGIGDEVVLHMLWMKDRLIRNACRYLSMTRGMHPATALLFVAAWQTEKDVRTVKDPLHVQMDLGVHHAGWVMAMWRRHWRTERAITGKRQNKPLVYSLDYAQQHPDEFTIHEDFNPRWYPPVRYSTDLEITDEDLGEEA